MSDCITPATDAIQGATFGLWEVNQGDAPTSEFTFTVDSLPVTSWVSRLAVVELWNGLAMVVFAPGEIVMLPQSLPADPTTIQISLSSTTTAVPTITGWYRMGTTNSSGGDKLTHRYGPFMINRTLRVDATLP